jgi:hypothetical protein
VGAWANAEFSASGKNRAAARTANRTTDKIAFIMHPSMTIEKLEIGASPYTLDNTAAPKRLNLSNRTPKPRPSAHTCMLV